LSSVKNTYKDTLLLIADILSFENPHHDLKQKIVSTQIDWEQFVTVASDHLVLTTSYCRLKSKELLQYLPKDLEVYLKEITLINRNRNLTLIKDIKLIATIFNTHNINHVFLKGSAFLIGNYYKDVGERMIGDIDILIEENKILKAYDLLLNQGYSKLPSGLKSTFFDHKHLDRLTLNEGLCAIELHKYVLNKPFDKLLLSSVILDEKQFIDTIAIPGPNHLYTHNILNFQINDKAHYYSKISMRSVYDTLILLKAFPKLLKTSHHKYLNSYLSLHSIFLKEFNTIKLDLSKIKRFETRLKSSKLNSFHKKKLEIYALLNVIPSRLNLYFTNKNYRSAIHKERGRIFKELKSNFLKN